MLTVELLHADARQRDRQTDRYGAANRRIFSKPSSIKRRNELTNSCNFSFIDMPVPVTARSEAYVCGRSPAEIVGSNPTGDMMSVCCECCVLSGRGLCDELITRAVESYRL